MFDKLRRKIIIFITLFAAFIFITLFAILCVANFFQFYNSSISTLKRIANTDIYEEWFDDEVTEKSGEDENINMGVLKIEAYYVNDKLVIDNDKSVYFSINENTLYRLTDRIIRGRRETGLIGGFDLLYYKTVNEENKNVIVFYKCGNELDYIKRLTLFSSIAAMLGTTAVFLASLFFSKKIVEPTENAWQQQQQFIANASHELKTPLTVILANNNILLNHTDEKIEERKHWIYSTQAEAEQMKKLVEEMLYLAKADANMLNQEKKRFNLSDVVMETALQFDVLAFEKGVVIDTETQDGIYVSAVETDVKRMVAILIDNAVKYSYKERSVTVGLKRTKNKAELRVCNFGDVIPEGDIDHIFDRFYRVDKSRTKNEVPGFGLGLSIAQNIAAASDGDIKCSSSIDDGTVFTVTIPLVD